MLKRGERVMVVRDIEFARGGFGVSVSAGTVGTVANIHGIMNIAYTVSVPTIMGGFVSVRVPASAVASAPVLAGVP